MPSAPKKERRKLPSTWKINVAAEEPIDDAPATTGGDYLDLDAQPRPRVINHPTAERAPVAEVPKPQAQPPAPEPEPPRAANRRPQPKQYKKRNINVTGDTEGRWDEIIRKISDTTPHAIKQSELFQAQVDCLHDARSDFDFSRVRRRGQWGTPQARAFRTTLREGVEEAIVRSYLKKRGIDLDTLELEEPRA